MESKKCLFSREIFKSNILRFMPFAAPLLLAEIVLFTLGIYTSVTIIDYVFSETSKQVLDISRFCSISIISDVFTLIAAGIFALLCFSYLFNSSKCNATHAFPIGRTALFITNFLSAYTLLVIPKLIGFAAGLPLLAKYSNDLASMAILQLASIFGVSFFLLSIAVLAIMLSGNFFSGAVMYVIINFIYVISEGFFKTILDGISYGVNLSFGFGGDLEYFFEDSITSYDYSIFASPFYALSALKYYIAENNPVTDDFVLSDYHLALAVICAVAVIICVVAYFLYRKRRLECAGNMVAFNAETPILSIITSILGGGYATLLLYEFLFFDVLNEGFLLVFFVIFSLIFYFAAQMVLRKKAKVFQGKQFIIWAAALTVTIISLSGTAAYLTNYMPKADDIKNVSLNATYDMELTSKEEINEALELHSMLIDTKSNESSFISWDGSNMNIGIYYDLKNGKCVARKYSVNPTAYEKINAALDKLETKHRPELIADLLEGIDYTITDCSFYDYYAETDRNFDAKETKELFEICKEDSRKYAVDYKSSKYYTTLNKEKEDDSLNFCFNCKPKDKKNAEKLDELLYRSDVTGCTISKSYDSEDDDETENEYEISFSVLSNLPEIQKYIS